MLIDINKIGKSVRFLNLSNDAHEPNLRFKLPASIPCTLEGINLNGADLDPSTDISGWDVSRFTGMPFMFKDMAVPAGVDAWDVSAVQNLHGTFLRAEIGAQNIAQWDVSSAASVAEMFKGSDFNGDISSWTLNASNVFNMLSETPYTHDLSSLVLPNVYFLDTFEAGDYTDVFWSDPDGVPHPQALRPKTAIEAGVGKQPVEIITEIRTEITSKSNTVHYFQEFDETNQLMRQFQDITDSSVDYYAHSENCKVKVFGNTIDKMTFIDVKEVTSWGGYTTAKSVKFLNPVSEIKVPATAPGWSDWAGLFAGCQDLSVEAESWDTSHVTNMNYLLPQDYSGSLDLSGWSVPLIASKPIGWPLPPERSPVWGV